MRNMSPSKLDSRNSKIFVCLTSAMDLRGPKKSSQNAGKDVVNV